MNALVLSAAPAPPRAAAWAALALFAALLLLPDCCLAGHRHFGASLEGMASICRAAR